MSAARETLVLHVDGDQVRLVQARPVHGKLELAHSCCFLSDKQDQNVSALRDETTLDGLAEAVSSHGWQGRDLICMIGGTAVACHYYDMPPLKGHALRQAAVLKLGQQMHFNVAEAVVSVQAIETVVSGTSQQTRVCGTAVHQDAAQAAVEAAQRIGLRLIAISAAPAAITAIARDSAEPDGGLQAFLHVEERATTLVVLEGTLPCVTSELSIGLADLTKALMRPIVSGDDVVQLDEAQAVALRNEVGIPEPDQRIESLGITGERLMPLLEPAIQEFAKQITQWLTFAATTSGGKVGALKIVGPGAAVPGLARILASRLSVKAETAPWLSEMAKLAGSTEGVSIDTFTVAVGAVRYCQSLPDLMPPEFQRNRRIQRVRSASAVCASILAVAIVGFGLLFDSVAGAVSESAAVHRRQLDSLHQVVEMNKKLASRKKTIAALERQFDAFAQSSPVWIGVFKELAALLPAEIQAAEFTGRSGEDGIQLTVDGRVYPGAPGSSFDESVEQTLLMLQRSPFFRRVRLLNANRQTGGKTAGAAGTFTIELGLVTPQPKV